MSKIIIAAYKKCRIINFFNLALKELDAIMESGDN